MQRNAASTSLRTLTSSLLVPFWVLAVTLTACAAPVALPTETPTPAQPKATAPATIFPTPTRTPSPTETAIRTPPALPGIYSSERLNPNDTPHTYVKDTCEYLKNRWEPNNAMPGTVVMVIMLNSINRGKSLSTDGISVVKFGQIVENLHEQDFEAINTEKLANFLEHNAYIPHRSVVFLQDGRYTPENFNRHFRPLWDDSGWPVVNAWNVQPGSNDPLWQDNAILEQEGWVDHQLYSPMQRYSDIASEQYLSDELKKYTNAFEEKFEKAPIAIIWPGKPGDNFIAAARNRDIRLGFTANPRGPLMYNWIPLGDHDDPSRKNIYPEGPFNDPLMTLPRYWPSQVVDQLDQIRLIGKKATDYAEKNKAIELEYYDIVCAPKYGPISGIP